MILHLDHPEKAQRWCQTARKAGKRLGFVPTMGALHDGHLSLVEASNRDNDATLVSIFVNPTQFNNPDDLEKYPRTLEQDLKLLDQAGVEMAFTGETADFYPELSNPATPLKLPDAGIYARGLEGAHRPGHFEGVREVVKRLFAIVGDCRAYFGEKDFQQTLVIKDLARSLPGIDIVVCPIKRAASGLALSSRNQHLSPEGTTLAATLYEALSAARSAWQRGERDARRLRARMFEVLDKPGISVEYADVRNPARWQAHSPVGKLVRAQALIAAEIEGVRLIDNLHLDS